MYNSLYDSNYSRYSIAIINFVHKLLCTISREIEKTFNRLLDFVAKIFISFCKKYKLVATTL